MKILLIIYDNGSYIHWFPQGMGYIAAVLRDAGHDITIYNQDIYHYPEEHLTEFLDDNKFDVVCVGMCGGYYQYKKLMSISKAINNSINRHIFEYILGGHMVSPKPEYFLRKTKADIVISGEGERTIVRLLNYYKKMGFFSDIKGTAMIGCLKDKCSIAKKRPLIKDIDSIPFPAYDLFPIEQYRLMRKPHATNTDFVMPVLSGRGCKFKCNFCYRMDEGQRLRSNKSIIEEIKLLKKDYGINYIVFSDECLMSSMQRTVDLSQDIIKANLNIKWSCDGRLNYATPGILRYMKDAGCVFINYGIEAFDNKVLENMNKGLTVKQIIKGVENTLNVGISPGLNMLWGNLSDTKETLEKAVNFLLKYDDGAQLRTIRPVTPYPGSELYYYAIKKGLLGGIEDFYENKHKNSDLLTVNFTDLSDDDFHMLLSLANTRLIGKYYREKQILSMIETADLYKNKNINFRGFRQT
jgi:radical SAM superfamily enzyme YgiQ (UPF0313 family)